jgi:hypothetical protein
MRKHISRALLAALVLAAPAWGQIQGSAQAGGLRYTLGDLAPDDGIAPSASFGPAPAVSLGAHATRLPFLGEPFQRDNTITVTAPASYAPDWLTEVRPAAVFDATGLHASLSVDPFEDATLVGIAGAHLSPWFFQLAPHTSITFSVDVAVDLALTEGDAATEFGGADALISLYYRTAGGLWSAPISDGVGGRIGIGEDGVFVPSVNVARTATVSWSNDSDGWIEGQMFYETGVLGQVRYGPPLPVPEPQSWAMLAAGLGLLAMKKRRARTGGNGVRMG